MFTVLCKHAHSDWQSTEAFLYVIGKSNIILKGKYIIVLNIKEKHNFNKISSIHIVEKPNQKGEHWCKCTELSLKRRRGNWRAESYKYFNDSRTNQECPQNQCEWWMQTGSISFLIHQHLEVLESPSLLQLDILPIEPSRFNFTYET